MSRIQRGVSEEMVNYFQNQANLLHLKAQNAGIFQNDPDTGDERENLLIDFLRLHLPDRCNVSKGGLIIDSQSNESKQVDIVVTNDLSLQFKKYHHNVLQKKFNCIEGCYSVISVKSSLDKDDLFDALDNLHSVPRLEDMPASPLVTDPHILLEEIPSRIIFAYKGPHIETTKKNLTEHQQDRRIQPGHMVDLIVVNNQYHISKVGYRGYQDPGRPFQEWGTMQYYAKTSFIGGISLMHMLTRIQKTSTFGSLIAPAFDNYYVQMKVSAERMEENPS
jgi:hypothetical protein